MISLFFQGIFNLIWKILCPEHNRPFEGEILGGIFMKRITLPADAARQFVPFFVPITGLRDADTPPNLVPATQITVEATNPDVCVNPSIGFEGTSMKQGLFFDCGVPGTSGFVLTVGNGSKSLSKLLNLEVTLTVGDLVEIEGGTFEDDPEPPPPVETPALVE